MHDPYSTRSLVTLAWPIVVGRASQAVVGFADALMVASLGEQTLAAVTTGSMNIFAVTIFPVGLVIAAQSFSSQLNGRGELIVALRYAWYALFFSVAVGVLAVAGIPAVGPVHGLLPFEPAVADIMTEYFSIRILGVLGIVGTEALGNWYGGLGWTTLRMRAGLVAMVSNIALNWVLIYGNLGAPVLGFVGAAWASVIATYLGFAVVLAAFLSGARLQGERARFRSLRWAEFGRLVRFGAPQGLNWFLEFAAFLVFVNVIVADLGTAVLAALMVVFNVNSVSFMPALGMSSAGAILSGQAIGAGHLDAVGKILKRTIGLCLVWQVSVGLCYLFLPGPFMRLFVDAGTTSQVFQAGVIMLMLSSAWQAFDSVAIAVGECLGASGDTLWPLWARIVLSWLVFVPSAVVFVMWMDGGYFAAMLCIIGYIGALALVLALRFRGGAWREIDLTGL